MNEWKNTIVLLYTYQINYMVHIDIYLNLYLYLKIYVAVFICIVLIGGVIDGWDWEGIKIPFIIGIFWPLMVPPLLIIWFIDEILKVIHKFFIKIGFYKLFK